MPELPDLEVFSHNLQKQLKGKTLKHITVHTQKLNVSEKVLQETLHGQKLAAVYREGKELYFKWSNGDILALHLMLHGKLFYFQDKNDQKFPIVELLFTDGSGLVLTDFQKAATPTLNPEPKTAPDALSDEANADYFKTKLAKKKTTIKTILLDQKIVRGIGNAYADEILWHARISPFSVANKIPEHKLKELVTATHKVLTEAQQQIIKHNPDIIAGEVRDFMLIHHPKKQSSPGGAPIQIDNGTRKTYYTEEQELFE